MFADQQKIFRNFLKTEFSEENLDFLLEVKRFRENPTNVLFLKIYKSFIKFGTSEQVSVKS